LLLRPLAPTSSWADCPLWWSCCSCQRTSRQARAWTTCAAELLHQSPESLPVLLQ
jgi:hypothetical protein